MTAGDSGGNYLSYGGFPENAAQTEKFLPSGVIFNNDIMNDTEFEESKILEYVTHSWYSNEDDGLQPQDGKTNPDVHKKGAYSFLKAPRYDDKPMEVGPLARMLVMKPQMLVQCQSVDMVLQIIVFRRHCPLQGNAIIVFRM